MNKTPVPSWLIKWGWLAAALVVFTLTAVVLIGAQPARAQETTASVVPTVPVTGSGYYSRRIRIAEGPNIAKLPDAQRRVARRAIRNAIQSWRSVLMLVHGELIYPLKDAPNQLDAVLCRTAFEPTAWYNEAIVPTHRTTGFLLFIDTRDPSEHAIERQAVYGLGLMLGLARINDEGAAAVPSVMNLGFADILEPQPADINALIASWEYVENPDFAANGDTETDTIWEDHEVFDPDIDEDLLYDHLEDPAFWAFWAVRRANVHMEELEDEAYTDLLEADQDGVEPGGGAPVFEGAAAAWAPYVHPNEPTPEETAERNHTEARANAYQLGPHRYYGGPPQSDPPGPPQPGSWGN